MSSGLVSGKWKLAWISRSSPMLPSASRPRSWVICAWNGKTNASQSSVPVSWATASTCRVSASVPHSGFSHSTGLPARSALIVHSACRLFGSGR